MKVKVKVKENQQWQEHEAEQADWLVVSHRLVSVEVLARSEIQGEGGGKGNST